MKFSACSAGNDINTSDKSLIHSNSNEKFTNKGSGSTAVECPV